MTLAYRFAILCGALPLTAGISIFLLWAWTRWDWLELAGIYTIYGGVGFFLLGMVSLARDFFDAWDRGDFPVSRVLLRTVGAGSLLVANFPVAGALVVSVVEFNSRYVAIVQNETDHPLHEVRVVGGGCDISFGTIQPGDAVQRTFWIQQDGSLELDANADGAPLSETISGYVTNGLGEITEVSVHRDHKVSVSSRSL